MPRSAINATAELLAAHPDAVAVVDAAYERGLTLSMEAVEEISRLKKPDFFLHWLAQPENFWVAHKLHSQTAGEQVTEIRKVAENLDRDGTLRDPSVDDYLKRRPQEKRDYRKFRGHR